ncbi:MAG: NAD(P)H-hydrate dehydratase [Clostridia bacterium]|nr:NAD(P)H-hydrate dehydratase [Clostridia bacterium]
MQIVTIDEMRKAEATAFSEYGVSSLVMMENAAQGFCDALEKEYGGVEGKSVCVFCGGGNNGGDGYAIARLLSLRGAKPFVVTKKDREFLSGDARTNAVLTEQFGIPISSSCPADGSYDIAVDSIYGIGFHGALSEMDRQMTECINRAPYVAAVDMPSGANAQNGSVSESCVRANLTVTFGRAKLGQFLYPAKEQIGKLVVVPISVPNQVWDELGTRHSVLTDAVFDLLPLRAMDSHKGSYGKVLALGGSKGMCGAAVLSAEAVLRSGAGMATLAVPNVISEIAMKKLTEVMVLPLKSEGETVSSEAFLPLKEKLDTQDVLLMGCGLGRGYGVEQLVQKLAQESEKPMVIDADGINAIAQNIDILKQKKAAAVLTPHPVEYSRLIGKDPKEWYGERVSIARKFAMEYQLCLVLKGADSLIATPDGRVLVNPVSNSGMATAGSGDVLAGVIAGLIAQGASAENAACIGVYLHALAGQIAKEQFGEYAMTAGDVLRALPEALKKAALKKE